MPKTKTGLLILCGALSGIGCTSSEKPDAGGSDTAGGAGLGASSSAAHAGGGGGSAGATPGGGRGGSPGGSSGGDPGGGSGGAEPPEAGSSGDGPSGDGPANATRCGEPGLTWRSAQKTHYTSYPDPGSEECVKYNGCAWAGQFAACDGKKSESWVAAHDIAAAFPDFQSLALHDLCLRKGSKTMVVTVLDTCGDDDCDGCCTENQGSADQLIDIESHTDARFGVPDGSIEWADLGPTATAGCE